MKATLSYLMGFVSIMLQLSLILLWCYGLGTFAFKMVQAYSWGQSWNGTIYFLSLACLLGAGLLVLWNGSRGLLGAWNSAELRLNEKLFGKVY